MIIERGGGGVYPLKYPKVCCFVWLWLYHQLLCINLIHLPILLRVVSLTLGQSYDCSSANGVTLEGMGAVGLTKSLTLCIFLVIHLHAWFTKLNTIFKDIACQIMGITSLNFRANSRLAPSQWEMSLQSNAVCNDVSHWLGANLELSLNFNLLNFNLPVKHMLAVGYQLITYELLARNTVRHWDMDRPAVWRRHVSWWRHQMETFSALLAICAGNSPVSSEFPTQRPVTRSFDVFLDLCRNKRCKAGDLRRHPAHYDVIVMCLSENVIIITHWDLDKMATILQTFSNAFSSMKIF